MEKKTCWFETADLLRLKELSEQTKISESALLRQFLSDGLNGYSHTALLIEQNQKILEELGRLKEIAFAGVTATALLNVDRHGPGKVPVYKREENVIFSMGALSLSKIIIESEKI